MKMFKNYLSAMFLAGVAMFTIGCDDNDEIAVDPDAEYDVVLEVSEATPTPNVNFAVNATTPETIEAKVAFTSTTMSMKRLYITVNDQGAGEELYEPSENIDLKADGSVDLTGKNDKDFEFAFTLPVPAADAGTVVYKFWTTTGNGDFRDITQRLAVGAGTITLTYGGVNPAAEVKTFTNLNLSAPAADGSSLTFVSLLDGQVYTAKPNVTNPTQEQFDEYISFWDFGYINKTVGGPSLHSTATYPSVAFSNFAAWSASTEPKNNCFFRLSTKTVGEFDAITTSAQLDFITEPANEFVTGLAEGVVIEFVDQYGKKGMIKVLEAVPGNSPGVNFVRVTIKVQP
jgi:hypothetical protein